jgi:hypothetical protein
MVLFGVHPDNEQQWMDHDRSATEEGPSGIGVALDLDGVHCGGRHPGKPVEVRRDRGHRRRCSASWCRLGPTSSEVGSGHGNTVDELRQLRWAAGLQDGSSVASMPHLRPAPIVGSLTLEVARRNEASRRSMNFTQQPIDITPRRSCAFDVNVISLRYQINNVVWEAS